MEWYDVASLEGERVKINTSSSIFCHACLACETSDLNHLEKLEIFKVYNFATFFFFFKNIHDPICDVLLLQCDIFEINKLLMHLIFRKQIVY